MLGPHATQLLASLFGERVSESFLLSRAPCAARQLVEALSRVWVDGSDARERKMADTFHHPFEVDVDCRWKLQTLDDTDRT